jgi:hypothetical protein
LSPAPGEIAKILIRGGGELQQIFVSFTPKAQRLNELRAQGIEFEEAFAIADSEYTSDGMERNHYVSVITQHDQTEEAQCL